MRAGTEQGRYSLFHRLVVSFFTEIDLPEDRVSVAGLQLEPTGGVFQVEADDGPIELAGQGVAAFLDRFVLLLPNQNRGDCGCKFPLQSAVDLSFQQLFRGMPAIREEESEAAAAAKIHDAFGFGLNLVVEHVGEGLDLGDYEMQRFEINCEIG